MARMSVSQMLSALVEKGRTYPDRPVSRGIEAIVAECHDLVSAYGEASGAALASRIVEGYLSLDDDERFQVLLQLDAAFSPDDANYWTLADAIEAPR